MSRIMLTGKANLQSLPIQKRTAPSVPHSYIGRNCRDGKQIRVGRGRGVGILWLTGYTRVLVMGPLCILIGVEVPQN